MSIKNWKKFTIQNVPIKYETELFKIRKKWDLQYRMFLLNQDIIEIADVAEQNLQYRMFLLNHYAS